MSLHPSIPRRAVLAAALAAATSLVVARPAGQVPTASAVPTLPASPVPGTIPPIATPRPFTPPPLPSPPVVPTRPLPPTLYPAAPLPSFPPLPPLPPSVTATVAPPVVGTPAAPAAPVSGGAATTGGDAPAPTPRPVAPAGVAVQPAPPRRPDGPTLGPGAPTPLPAPNPPRPSGFIALGATLAPAVYGVTSTRAYDLGGSEPTYASQWRGAFGENSLRVINWYLDLDNNGDFPANSCSAVHSLNATPMISFNTGQMHPLEKLSDGSLRVTTKRQVNGMDVVVTPTLNEFWSHWADGARQWSLQNPGKSVYFRFNWEMNLNAFPWAGRPDARNRFGTIYSTNSPEWYVDVWKFARGYFRDVPAVKWVWCPNAEEGVGGTEGARQEIMQYYPYDANQSNVDWVGLDGYNFAEWNNSPDFPWRTWDEVFLSTYTKLATNARTSTKPLLIAETGVGNKVKTGDATKTPEWWIDDARARIAAGAYPNLRAILYYNIDATFEEGVPDWRLIDQHQFQLRTGLTNPYYRYGYPLMSVRTPLRYDSTLNMQVPYDPPIPSLLTGKRAAWTRFCAAYGGSLP